MATDPRVGAARALLADESIAIGMTHDQLWAVVTVIQWRLRDLVALFDELPWLEAPESGTEQDRRRIALLAEVPVSQRAEGTPDDEAAAVARVLAAIPDDVSVIVTSWLRAAKRDAASPDLAARRTAAAAVNAGFRRSVDDYLDDGPAPHWQGWAWQLSSALKTLSE